MLYRCVILGLTFKKNLNYHLFIERLTKINLLLGGKYS